MLDETEKICFWSFYPEGHVGRQKLGRLARPYLTYGIHLIWFFSTTELQFIWGAKNWLDKQNPSIFCCSKRTSVSLFNSGFYHVSN